MGHVGYFDNCIPEERDVEMLIVSILALNNHTVHVPVVTTQDGMFGTQMHLYLWIASDVCIRCQVPLLLPQRRVGVAVFTRAKGCVCKIRYYKTWRVQRIPLALILTSFISSLYRID